MYYHYSVPYTENSKNILEEVFRSFQCVSDATAGLAKSIQVVVDIIYEDNNFSPPGIEINGVVHYPDNHGDCVDIITNNLGIFFHVRRDDGTLNACKTRPDDITRNLKYAPQCEGRIKVFRNGTYRRCMNKSRKCVDGQIRCHNHLDIAKYLQYK